MTSAHSDDRDKKEKPQRRITMKDIARELGISHVAVSYALRNLNEVSEDTRQRVLKKAEEMGYVSDPLLSVLSRYRLDSKNKPIQAELAWINSWDRPEELYEHAEFKLYWDGATASAKRFGFELVKFNAAEIPLKRLESILKARNIKGILMAPLEASELDWSTFSWNDFATVRFGRTIPQPETHFVSSAQINNTILAFNKTHELGYQRIGLACDWLKYRFFGIGFAWAQQHVSVEQQLPTLSLEHTDSFEKKKQKLNNWIKKTNPDAIITDSPELPLMLENLGYRIPEDIGLATLSINDTPIDTGINQEPFDMGRAAVRQIVALLSENNFGLPENRHETLIGGTWVDGSMLPPRNT
ncbi:LacI family DNA-binding transcriptional regulator [Pontiellaceae bacterium B1224]|nr:LacI family DNA-binding transcriptional regulator [Pontiellaceae bacterium B1224]